MHVTSLRIELVDLKCWACGCNFSVEHAVYENKRQYGKTLHCPNGCHLGFGDTPEQKLRKEMEQKLAKAKREKEYLEAQRNDARAERDAARKSLSATKGVLTRTKRRVAHGTCPCCHRTFKQLASHMADMHPDYVAEAKNEVA